MIYGYFNTLNDHNIKESLLKSLSDNISWNNCTFSEFSDDVFFYRFLANKDLKKEQNDNIFSSIAGDSIVIIDGYIYNQSEIKSNLNFSGEELSISELIYKAYLKWGEAFAEKLNGDFAICIYLRKSKEVLFYRDHLGLRPLAIAHSDEAVYFATDPMGLCKSLFKNEKIESEYLLNLFLYEGFKYSLLPHKQIFNLKPGHYLRITTSDKFYLPYWFPEKIQTDYSLSFKIVEAEIKNLVYDSIRIRSDKSFKASAHLSGGLDSGVVASIARKEYFHQSEFYGFSWSPQRHFHTDSINLDERLLVEKICLQNDITSLYSNFDVDDYLSFVSEWRHPSELIFEKKIIEACRAKGINLIFSGWGGDEFISINNRGIDADLIRSLKWIVFLKKYPLYKPKKLISALLFNVFFPSARRKYSKYKAESSIYQYIKKESGSNIIPRKERFHYSSRKKVHLQLIRMQHLASRASDWYVLGQRNGIEYRYPLLDKRIVEYMIKVPSHCLVDGDNNRRILREIGKALLPVEVVSNRSKDDPVKSNLFISIVQSVKKQFINEFEAYRNNPDLSFIDFDLLKENLPKILAAVEKGEKEDGAEIFYYLKSAHEFTKGYYN